MRTVEGRDIKAGDAIAVLRDPHTGKFSIIHASFGCPGNATAVEDLVGPDICWNQQTGQVSNYHASGRVSGLVVIR